MTPTEFFAYLGAPLANQRWSWGAERPSDGAIFLRVWQDECRTINDRKMVAVTANNYFRDKPDNLGNAERLRHVELIRSGRSSFMIMCVAQDKSAEPRSIAKFNDREVFVGGELIEHEGDVWLERVDRVPIDRARTNNRSEVTRSVNSRRT